MFTLQELLNWWIPYRLEAIQTLRWAWSLSESNPRAPIQLHVNGRCRLEGNVAAVTNPMIEAGFIHARALLEFLGLSANKDGKLLAGKERRPGDIAVEHFSTPTVTLKRATLASVAAAYPGPRQEAEDALVAIFETSNRWLAHVTDGAMSKEWTDQYIDVALRGIPVLVHNHLYAPLGLQAPHI
ncbi:hypothetical protein ADT25_17840 [Xanthomonas oryzae]|uniref:Uncharacterized protein n=1 Tax=Xanthomonas oryzae TaxID=347 RepID=A0AAP1EWW8_9XANT|nr:hypothetical protein [Xanthomonas oryzae]KOR41055.1 hypothetical protein ADT25_17840 [Xanthomonas oryzae]QBG85861.1 hypothetical protein EYR27_21370 [Xanthomonas oryzae]